jgi:Flp pilus assembly protein TadG
MRLMVRRHRRGERGAAAVCRRTPSARQDRPPELGAAAVEFALVVPLLLMIVFGGVDVGRAINRDVVLNNAVSEAAREGSLNADCSDGTTPNDCRDAIKDVASNAAGHTFTPGVDLEIQICTRTGANVTCTPDLTTALPGKTVRVTLTEFNKWVTPAGALMSMFPGKTNFGDGVSLSESAEMRIE